MNGVRNSERLAYMVGTVSSDMRDTARANALNVK